MIEWGRANKGAYLTKSLWHFVQGTQAAGPLDEDPYRYVCDWIESCMPETPAIKAWRIANGRVRHRPTMPGDDRLFTMLLMPRLTRKTSILKCCMVLALTIDPNIRMLLCRATEKKSQETLRGVKFIIESNPTYTNCFPSMRAKFSEWTAGQITRGDRTMPYNEPTISCSGLDSGKAGTRSDWIIPDDIVHEDNFESPGIMESAENMIYSLVPILDPTGSVLVIGTRWPSQVIDTYGRILQAEEDRTQAMQTRQWYMIVWGAYKEDNTPRFPAILSEAAIEAYRVRVPEKFFTAWILNHHRMLGDDIFSLSHLRFVDVAFSGGAAYGGLATVRLLDTPEMRPLIARFGHQRSVSVVMLIDPAPTVGPRACETGIVVVAFDDEGNYWVLAGFGVKKLPDERLNFICKLALQYPPELIALENADMSAPLLEERMSAQGTPCKVVGYDPRMDRKKLLADAKLAPHGLNSKAAQIENLEPIVRAGRVFVNRQDTTRLVQQITKYPYTPDGKVDVLDAFSMAPAYEGKFVQRAKRTLEEIMADQERIEYELAGLDFNQEVRAYRSGTPTTKSAKIARNSAGLMAPP